MIDYKTIGESKNFIVLDKYTRGWKVCESYQSEYALEQEFVQDLRNQGYEYLPELTTPQKMLANVCLQLQALNNVQFADGEWLRFVEEYLDKPSDGIIDKTRNIHDNHIHDFVFDDGHIRNIYLVDKKNIKLFGEYLRVENVLHNYDEFAGLKALQNVNMSDPKAVEEFIL